MRGTYSSCGASAGGCDIGRAGCNNHSNGDNYRWQRGRRDDHGAQQRPPPHPPATWTISETPLGQARAAPMAGRAMNAPRTATFTTNSKPTSPSTMPSIAKMVFGNGPLGPSYVLRPRIPTRSLTALSSFAPWIRQYPGVQKYWARWSNLYRHAAGYRQKGYLLDDLVMEESKTVQKVSRDLWPCRWIAWVHVFQAEQMDAARVCRSVQESATQKGNEPLQRKKKNGLNRAGLPVGVGVPSLPLCGQSEYTLKEILGNKEQGKGNSSKSLVLEEDARRERKTASTDLID